MSLANNTLRLFNRDIIFSIVRLFTGVIIARALGPVGVGVWAALDLINNYARVFGAPRFEIASVHFMPKKEYAKGEIILITNIIAVLSSLILVIILSFNIGYLKTVFFKNVIVQSSLLIATISYLPILFANRNYLYFLLSQENIKSYNFMLIIQDSTKTVLTILLLIYFKVGLWSLTISLLISGLISLCYGAYKVHQEKIEWHFSLDLLKNMFNYSYKIYFSEGIAFLSIYLSNLLTAIFLSPISLAFFSMGKGKAEYLNRITNAVSTVLFPRISNQNAEGKDSKFLTTKAFRISIIVLTVLGGLGSVLIYPTVLILYGREFLQLVKPFWITILGLILFSSTNIHRQYFMGIGRPDIPLKISIFPLILQLTLCYWLIPIFGIIGASVAVSVTFFLTGVITFVVFNRVTSISYKEILLPKRSDILLLKDIVKEKSRLVINRLKSIFSMRYKIPH